MIEIRPASSKDDLRVTRQLFLEYAGSLDFQLCFQSFEQELARLPGKYAPPQGRLLLACPRPPGKIAAAGCVAVRPLDDGICEMKRLYVQAEFRRQGIGRALSLAAIEEARSAGYRSMRLDTVASMQAAIALYESLGFARIAAYYPNPLPDVVYMELNLAGG